MLLTETFSYQIGTIKNKKMAIICVLHILMHIVLRIHYGIRKQIQSYGAKWEPNGKVVVLAFG